MSSEYQRLMRIADETTQERLSKLEQRQKERELSVKQETRATALREERERDERQTRMKEHFERLKREQAASEQEHQRRRELKRQQIESAQKERTQEAERQRRARQNQAGRVNAKQWMGSSSSTSGQRSRGGRGGGGGGGGGRRRKRNNQDDDDDPDMYSAANNNSLLINGYQQRVTASGHHKVLQEHEIRVVHDPSQASACNDLIALDQNRRDRTTIEDLYMEREKERESALKRIKKEHGDKMIDLFGMPDIERPDEHKSTTKHQDKLNTKTSQRAPPIATTSKMTSSTRQQNTASFPSPWAPRNGGKTASTATNTTNHSLPSSSSSSHRFNPVKVNTDRVNTSTASRSSIGLPTSKMNRHSSAYPSPSKEVRHRPVNTTNKANHRPTTTTTTTSQAATKARRYMKDEYDDDDEEDEYDDYRGSNNYSSVIQNIFGYDRRRYRDEDSDVDDMEASIYDIKREETHSTRVAREEDEREAELERLEMERLAARRKKRPNF